MHWKIFVGLSKISAEFCINVLRKSVKTLIFWEDTIKVQICNLAKYIYAVNYKNLFLNMFVFLTRNYNKKAC